MNEPEKFVDLLPGEWKSEREKPKEPIFGDGLPNAIAYLVGFVIVFSMLYAVKH